MNIQKNKRINLKIREYGEEKMKISGKNIGGDCVFV